MNSMILQEKNKHLSSTEQMPGTGVEALMSFLGQGCRIESILTLDLQNYKHKLQSSYASVDQQNLHIGLIEAMFHWARKNDVLEPRYKYDIRISTKFSRLMKKIGTQSTKAVLTSTFSFGDYLLDVPV